jgi:hypothetical protein
VKDIRFGRGTRRTPLKGSCVFCSQNTTRELVWVLKRVAAVVVPVHDPDAAINERQQSMHVCDWCFQRLLQAPRTGEVRGDAIAWGRRPGELDLACQCCSELTADRLIWPKQFGQSEGDFSLVPFCGGCLYGVAHAAEDAHSLLPQIF